MSISFGKEFGIGCGDNSCRWGASGGMATNGGCRCPGEKEPRQTDAQRAARMTKWAGVSALRTLATSPEILAALHALVRAAIDAEPNQVSR